MRESTYWDMHGIDVLAICEQLWEARDDLEKMQQIAANPIILKRTEQTPAS
jgi:hypothetical protein